MNSNQRRYTRSASYIIAKYTVLEGTLRDVIKDIGAGGLSVRTAKKIAVGQPITIEFPLFQIDNLIKVSGRIVRRDLTGFAVTFNEPIHGLICKEGYFPEIVDNRKDSDEKHDRRSQ
jgi:hypothetical protein